VAFTDDEIRELANSFCDPLAGMQLLDAAGLERGRHPAWQASNAEQFWREVSALVVSGALAGGRQRILAEARRQRPTNPAFPAGRLLPCRMARHTAGAVLLARPGRVRYMVPMLAAIMAVTLTVVSWLAGWLRILPWSRADTVRQQRPHRAAWVPCQPPTSTSENHVVSGT
jgi:hypothetical protein